MSYPRRMEQVGVASMSFAPGGVACRRIDPLVDLPGAHAPLQLSADASRPSVVSLPTPARTPPRVKSFAFAVEHDPPALTPPSTPHEASSRDRSGKRTRFQLPADMVRLSDRLFYVLQPSLEAIVGDGRLEFPSSPFPYQLEGMAFLYPRYAAVLADEMGLGKTMQAIATIRMLLHGNQVRRVLLICPKPLVSNWQREFRHWAPEIPQHTIRGHGALRAFQWRQRESVLTIANYELVVRDQEIVNDPDLSFDLVVLDESQRIKNKAGVTNQVVRRINRKRSWALTGTPLENSPEDLVGMFEFVAPGVLSSKMTPRRIGRSVSDYVLRRVKADVLKDLPPKLFRDASLELTPSQRQTYELAENEGVLRLTEMGQGATIQHVFELVLRLKQICNFDPATGESAKLERLLADVDEVAASGKKAIIFSQWVDTLVKLRDRLKPFRPLEYHGRIPTQSRESVIARFRDDRDSSVLLMSYGAGSVGLNLQFCEYVFLYDRWWNPAVEDQAINRAHRIGAAGPVTVTRFLSLDTIEQRIDEVLQQKRELFETVFSEQQSQRLGMSQEEIFGLFRLSCPHGPIRQAA